MSFLERVDQTIRRSPVWRSIFRNAYPDDERSRAYKVMNSVFLHLHPVRVRQHAVRFAYTFCLGGLSFFLFLVLTVTGVYLMFFYVPADTQAYTNILDIQSRVVFGLLTRNIHRWAAHLMVFFVFLHMMRVFYHGAYKPPREFNWVVGVILLFLTIMLSFTGYLLPWDQIAYWAITIGTNMAGYAPLFNTHPSCCCSAASRSARTRCCGSMSSTSWCSHSSRPSSLRCTSGGSARTAASVARCERPGAVPCRRF